MNESNTSTDNYGSAEVVLKSAEREYAYHVFARQIGSSTDCRVTEVKLID